MAVARTSDTDKLDVVSGNDAFTSFAVSGSNPAIFIVASALGSTVTVSSVVCSAGLSSGTPYLVKKATQVNSNVEIWAIPAPSGTGTITVSYSSSVNHQCCAVLVSDADQTTPGVTADSTTTVNSGVQTISTTPTNVGANDAVVYGVSTSGAGADTPHATAGTEIFFGNSTSINMAAGFRAGSGAVTGTYNDFNDHVIVGVRIQQPTGGGGFTAKQRRVLGQIGRVGSRQVQMVG